MGEGVPLDAIEKHPVLVSVANRQPPKGEMSDGDRGTGRQPIGPVVYLYLADNSHT
jgi:hypothetical protein